MDKKAKIKNTVKEATETYRNKVSQEQGQSLYSSVNSTYTAMGCPPPPQTSSSTPSSTHLPERHISCFSFLSFFSHHSVALAEDHALIQQEAILNSLKLDILAFIPVVCHLTRNQKTQVQRKITTRRDVLQKGPKTVMALKAAEPFEYESPEEEKSTIFHATVVTARQFFQLKVFNNLKKKFTKQKVIIKSDYREYKEILEINKASSVSEVGLDQKSDSLLKQASGIFVYGLFVLHQKKVNRKNTIYEIQASIGKINVVGNGKWYNINCKEGDKLFCFQLRTIDQKLKLTSGKFLF
ncbi:hypothetical protein R6Z07F_001046 [Ovis aries]